MIDELELVEAVAEGAAFMDAIDKGLPEAERWYWVVEPATLDMSHGRRCVAGQVNGSVGNDQPGFYSLGILSQYKVNRSAFNMYGALRSRTAGLRTLTALWVEQINDRRAAYFDRHPEAVLA